MGNISSHPALPAPAAWSDSQLDICLDQLGTAEGVVRDQEVELAVLPDRVEVRDRGAGVPPSVRPRLYEPFATGRPDGTGLGLAVCQRITTAYGGALAHVDRDGGGTVATWRIRA